MDKLIDVTLNIFGCASAMSAATLSFILAPWRPEFRLNAFCKYIGT